MFRMYVKYILFEILLILCKIRIKNSFKRRWGLNNGNSQFLECLIVKRQKEIGNKNKPNVRGPAPHKTGFQLYPLDWRGFLWFPLSKEPRALKINKEKMAITDRTSDERWLRIYFTWLESFGVKLEKWQGWKNYVSVIRFRSSFFLLAIGRFYIASIREEDNDWGIEHYSQVFAEYSHPWRRNHFIRLYFIMKFLHALSAH